MSKSKFKVGDIVRRIDFHNEGKSKAGEWLLNAGDIVMVVEDDYMITVYNKAIHPEPMVGNSPGCFELVLRPSDYKPEFPEIGGGHNHTATSKAAAKKVKAKLSEIEQLVYECIRSSHLLVGRTGREIADITNLPLNSVTPRFAPLRRKGKIKDSSRRVDGQIVWVAV